MPCLKDELYNGFYLLVTPENAEISFEKICFEYIHGQRILQNMSFTVPAGKSYAIVGGSGSGKSTIIRLLYRFFDPSSGSIRIGGEPIDKVDLTSLRKVISVAYCDNKVK